MQNKKDWSASPGSFCVQVVKNVSDILTSSLPETIMGWRLGRGELATILTRAALLGAHPTRTAEILGTADEDTVSYQLRKVGMNCPQKLNLEISTTAAGLLKGEQGIHNRSGHYRG